MNAIVILWSGWPDIIVGISIIEYKSTAMFVDSQFDLIRIYVIEVCYERLSVYLHDCLFLVYGSSS